MDLSLCRRRCGYAWTHLLVNAALAPAGFPLLGGHFDQTQGNFAFQAIGGLSFPIPRVPGLLLTVEYRCFGVREVSRAPKWLQVPCRRFHSRSR
jgi:hypothetical protein